MSTVLDALADRLASATAHNHVAEHPPVIVLWTDGDRKWVPALPALRKRLPNLWTLGDYEPASDQGPAAWVKWRLGQLKAGDPVPVLYLPGVRRLQFRALEDFPEELMPIAELQFRGTWWTQVNGKDWTPLAFLTSKKGGLGLSVAEDADTIGALDGLVARVLETPVAELKKGRLEAEHFVALLSNDIESDLLDWLDYPEGTGAGYPDSEWAVFRDFVKRRLGVDLDRDGPIVVAEHLVQRNGGWGKVWARYEVGVPERYTKVHLVLEKAQPAALIFDKSTLPRHNDQLEHALRAALAELGEMAEVKARLRVRVLENEHGPRRDWVWAKLGKARMAMVLEHLVALADATEASIGGTNLNGVAAWYSSVGWKADGATLAALAFADHVDGATVHAAVRALYLPWLQRVAEHLREIVQASGYPKPQGVLVEVGTCLLFADGLRWDVGAALAERLAADGKRVELGGRWGAFPPVTGTSKPDISAIRDQLTGGTGATDFTPSVKTTGKMLDSATFRKLMDAVGVQMLEGNATGDPSGRGWTEFGDIDKYGHKHGCKIARHVHDQLRELEQRVAELLAAGWKRVRIATDHGWLLVPGGMPPAKVPAGLADSRWGRCAMLKATSKADLPTLPWAWNESVEVTYAPGVCAFYANTEYAHGGLTVQECYTPVLTVALDKPSVTGSITELKWVGMRCKAKLTTTASGLRFDLRAKVADAGTSLLDTPRTVGADGTCSVPVADDSKAGTAAFAVLLAPDGTVLDKRPTTVGGDA